jgi:hypothetical protein
MQYRLALVRCNIAQDKPDRLGYVVLVSFDAGTMS